MSKRKDQSPENYQSIFDAPKENTYKGRVAKPKTKGSRYVTNVVISLALCVAIALGVIAVRKMIPSKGDGDQSQSTLSVVSSEPKKILSGEEAMEIDEVTKNSDSDNDENKEPGVGGVKKIKVVNPAGEYVLDCFMGEEETIDPSTGEYITQEALRWTISQVKGVDVTKVSFSSDTLGFLVGDLLGITYESIYTQDASATIPQGDKTYTQECGLDKATAKLTMCYDNGTTKTLIIGDKTPAGNGYFVSFATTSGKEGTIAPVEDKKIYVVSDETVVFLLKDPTYFVNKSIVEPVEQAEETFDDEGNMIEDPYFISGALSYFEELTLSGGAYEKEFAFKVVEEERPGYDSIYLMTSPYTQNVDLTAMENLLKPVADGLVAYNCLAMNATPAQIEKYGLSQPTCVARYVVKEKEYIVRIGKQTDAEKGYYAVMVKDNPSIFEVSGEDIIFQTYDTAAFASNTVYSCNIQEIATMRVETKDFDQTFRLQHGTDAQGEATLSVTTATGVTVNSDDFRSMYMGFLGLNSFTNVTDGKDAKTPYMTITITYHDYEQVDVIRLSPYTERRYFMSLNGMGSTVVLSNVVEPLEQSIRALVQ